MAEDAELLRCYLENGSEDAFSMLVRRHVDFVYGAALRMTRSTHPAEEVTQSVFTDLCRKARKLAGRRDLAGWLYLSTRNASAQLIRSEVRREQRELKAGSLQVLAAESASTVDWDGIAPVLDEVLAKMSAADRDAILLRFFKTASFGEIGSALQLSENAARMRVERALEKARKLLARSGVVSSSAALELALASQPAVAAPVGLAVGIPGIALATVAGGSTWASMAALWTLMNATKLTIAAIGLVAIVGLGTSLEFSMKRTEAAIRTADTDLSRFQHQLNEESKRAAAAEAVNIRQAHEGEIAKAAQKTVTIGPRAAMRTKAAEIINQNPEVHEAVGKLVEYDDTRYFGPLLHSAGLSDTQVQRAEYLLAQLATFNDVGPVSLSFKTDPRPAAEITAELAQVIGQAGAASLATYQINRSLTAGLSGNLNASGIPLTNQQFGQLTQILVSTNQSPAEPGKWDDPKLTDWPAALQRAQNILSPAQLHILKDFAVSRLGADLR